MVQKKPTVLVVDVCVLLNIDSELIIEMSSKDACDLQRVRKQAVVVEDL